MIIAKTVWENVNRLQEYIAATDGEMSDICHISRKQYRTRRTTGRSLTFSDVCYLSDAFNFSLTKLARNDIDAKVAASFYKGDHKAIPGRYLIGAASRARSAINILNHIGTTYGETEKRNALQYIQCSEDTFDNDTNLINVNLSQELFNYLTRLGETSYFSIGLQTSKILKKSPISDLLKSYQNAQDMYQGIALDHHEKIENNNIYTITHSSKGKTILRSQLNPAICEALKTKTFGSCAMSEARAGIMASLNIFQSGKHANVSQTKCHYRGDKYSEFVLLH